MSNKFFGTNKSKSAVDDLPMVSVIIAVYNVEAYLRQCLDSVIGQTLRHIEIICVDDGSTDSSLQILKEYQLKDSRIRIIRQAHAGAGAARNKGLQAARGEYLSILDSDDFFEPDMLKKAYYAAKVEDADIVVFKSDFYDEQEHRFTPCDYSVREDMLPKINPFGAMDIPDRIFNIGCGWAWDKLFRRDFVEENRARFQEIRTSNDMFFVFYLYSKAGSIYVMNGLFAHRRINAYNTLSVTRELSWDDFYHALMALKEQLAADGTYDIFRHSFVNWALNFSLWHIDTLDKELSREVKQKCREEYFEKLDILNHDPSYFLYDREYKRLERIMGQAKVSVVIPVYNGERYVRQCLDSVCGQTLQEIQIICVNDGSTDGTADILREYESRDDRITVVDKEHTNAGEGRNAGMKLAEGEYISFLDADDFFEPDMLESAYLAIQDADAQICAFRCDQFDNQTKQFHECPWTLKLEVMPEQRPFSSHDCADNIFTMTSCTAWDKLYRRSFVLENKIEFQSVPSCNDMLFTFSAYVNADKITTLDRILVHQRVNHAKTLSRDIEYLWHNFYDALFALKNYLIDHRIYETYKRSFVNWAIDFSIWNMYNYRRHFRDLIRQSLKRRFFDDLDITSSPQELFSNQDLYNEMRQIMSEKKERDKNITPKVSIIIPTYNVEQYLRVCLDSAVNQTLEDIEIIIVNDGSTDNSLEIIKEYAAEDDRIVVIDKENGGYGMAMNCGMDRARGEYIGIIEPDDFVDVNMFGDLYNIAKEQQVDYVKGDFYRFTHDIFGNLSLEYNDVAKKKENYGVIKNPAVNKDVFRYVMNTWSGIYKRSFIEKYHIRHNETPGASFQDNGFWFFTLIHSNRLYFVDKPYYYNRRDNPNSSVASRAKVYCMNEEYSLIRNKLNQFPELEKEYVPYMNVKRFLNYVFTYDRIDPTLRFEYTINIRNELSEAVNNNEVDWTLFTKQEYEDFQLLLNCPGEFMCRTKIRKLEKTIAELKKRKDKTAAKNKTGNKTVHVVNITDDNYCMPTSVALTSLKINRRKDVVYKVHIVSSNISEENRQRLGSLADENFIIDIREVELDQRFAHLTKADGDLHVSPAAIIKLFLPKILSDVGKVLYFDGDVLVQRDLLELYNIDITDQYAAAVKDIISERNHKHLRSIGYPHQFYFNSGMLLLNLTMMRKMNVTDQLVNYRLYGRNHFMDQDALNVVLGLKVKYISPIYNFLNKFYDWWDVKKLSKFYGESFPETAEKAYANAVILHLGSHEKPWKYEMGYLSDLYDKYYSKSPFANVPLVREKLPGNL